MKIKGKNKDQHLRNAKEKLHALYSLNNDHSELEKAIKSGIYQQQSKKNHEEDLKRKKKEKMEKRLIR